MAFQRVCRLASIPALCLVLILFTASGSFARGLLRDADIEHALEQLSAPILRAAGLSPARVKVLIVNDSSLNAFVVNSRAIFIHYGLVLKADTPEMLQAVIAHEAAHIANGHIARRTGNARSAQTLAGLGIALALAAAASGANSQAVGGLATGLSSSALRGFLKHTRAEEAAADQAAAQYMSAAGISPVGLLDVHRLFRGQEALTESRQDPYMRSHPLTRDRIRAAEAFVAAYGNFSEPNDAARYWFARAKGKLSAFTRSTKWTMRRVSEEEFKDVRLMREAVAFHRSGEARKALQSIDAAIQTRGGQDGFYYDLKGQFLFENRRFDAAVETYGRAVMLAPREAQILGGLGRAQLATNQFNAAVETLEQARARDLGDARILRDLGQAYARVGKNGQASLATAERYALLGRLDDAKIHATRAMGLLPRGSVGWRRAEDVFFAAENAEKRR